MRQINGFLLHDDETLDKLQLDELKIIQSKSGYRFNIDSVLLAFYADLTDINNAIDLGAGSGIIPLILSYRSKNLKVTGIELSDSAVDRARRNVLYNGLTDCITIIKADIKRLSNIMPPASAEMVITNPPFWKKGEGRIPQNPERAMARHELEINLEQVITAAGYLLSAGGKLYIAQRMERLEEALVYLNKYNFKQTSIKPVQAFKDRPANLALIEGKKDHSRKINYLPPLAIYNHKGSYTEEVKKIYNG